MASRPRSGTGYIGLEQWLGQNQQQAGAMANAMADGIDEQGKKAQGILNYAVEEFENGADGAALNYDGDGFYDQFGAPTADGYALANQRATDAEKALKEGYKGPGPLDKSEAYGTGRKLGMDAQGDANLASDFYGRQALLQEQAGKGGGYSLGQQRLDSALVGAAGGDRIDATRAQWGSLLGKFDAASERTKAYGAGVEQQNKDTAARYRAEATKLQEIAAKGRKADAADAKKLRQETQGTDAQTRIDQREADRQAIADGRIPADGPKGGLRVDEWAAKKRPGNSLGAGRKTGWPTNTDKNNYLA